MAADKNGNNNLAIVKNIGVKVDSTKYLPKKLLTGRYLAITNNIKPNTKTPCKNPKKPPAKRLMVLRKGKKDITSYALSIILTTILTIIAAAIKTVTKDVIFPRLSKGPNQEEKRPKSTK